MSGVIKALERESVQRIHSGQVVLDLQSAIKELVENSLDAGATIIDVRIKDHGLESVEVVDNGSGIAEADWGSIGMRHHTSKLPSLEDLYKVTTFGFRGEAISALCALCESVIVTTATKETAPMGTVIKLGNDGTTIDASEKVARNRGTTISLTGLFVPLPVRRKEFERTVKRELSKALSLLTAYALVPASTSKDGRMGVRLKVETIGGGRAAKRNTQLATDGKGSIRSAVGAVWGAKAVDGVKDIDLDMEVEIDRVMARREGIAETTQNVKVTGLISSAQWGQGRSSADRQFYYINGRPCNLTSVARAVNEVYKSFNTNQLPLAILNFQIPPQSIDINVSPDKRTIFVHSEDRLIEALKAALEAFFEPTRNTFTVHGASQTAKSTRHVQSQLSLSAVTSSGKDNSGVEDAMDVDGEDSTCSGDGDKDHDYNEETTTQSADPSQSTSYSSRSKRPTVVPPEQSGDEDEPMEIIMTPANTSSPPQSSRPTRRRPPTPPTSQSSRSIKSVQQTVNTTTASWSPDKKATSSRKASRQGRQMPEKDARLSLRKRLESYASQGTVVRDESEEEDSGEEEEEEEAAVEEDDNMDEEASGETSEKEDAMSEGDQEDAVKEADVEILTKAAEPLVKRQKPLRAGNRIREISDDEGPTQVSSEAEAPQEKSVAPDKIYQEASSCSSRRKRAGPIFEDESPTSDFKTVDSPPHLEEALSAQEPVPDRPASSRQRRQETEDASLIIEEGQISTDHNPSPPSPFEQSSSPSVPPPSTKERASSPHGSTSTYRDEIISMAPQGEIVMRFDLPRVRARYAAKLRERPVSVKAKDAFQVITEGGLADAAGILNKDAGLAEAALSRVISKTDFEKMKVLGQFNRGFIIARLVTKEKEETKTDDLFIIDQHASDEKYNFETLQQTTKIKGQALIRPRPLQLTAGEELVAIDNLNVLNANGFDVRVDEDKPAGRGERISLMAMPVSKDTTFDFKDLEQLLHLLSDGSRPANQMVRCTKARAMFASRACRKSVMIGKALTKSQMTQLIRNMSTIDQPWNCPHGRPTMRHLTKLEASSKSRSGRGRIDWTRWKNSLA